MLLFLATERTQISILVKYLKTDIIYVLNEIPCLKLKFRFYWVRGSTATSAIGFEA